MRFKIYSRLAFLEEGYFDSSASIIYVGALRTLLQHDFESITNSISVKLILSLIAQRLIIVFWGKSIEGGSFDSFVCIFNIV